ncbi:MAG: 3-isopropylmalate dehydratase large subunit [Candidatus Bathyarchaeia archaeon]
MNLTKKILARASGQETVEAGDFIEARVDRVMIHDLTGPLALDAFSKLKDQRVWDVNRVVVIFDHNVPANTTQSSSLQKRLRRFVEDYNIVNFYDVGRGGICHQVMPEKGYVAPGEVIVGADSHTCTYGAFGAFATGVGSTDVAAAMATGRLWFKVPETLKVTVTGRFKRYVFPKDLILSIVGTIGEDGANYKGIEFTGPTIRDMSVDGRMTLSNMVVEVGAKTGIIEPDDKTLEYLEGRLSGPINSVSSDPGAYYEEELNFSVEDLEPQVACPHSVANVKLVKDVEGVRIDQAFIGSCTNGRLDDLRVAANILKGRRVKAGVRMIVIPASQDIYKETVREGLAEIFVEAGAYFGGPTCGPCMGSHLGILADGEVCISSTNRNFLGRMGNPKAEVYLASPATVAASALKGCITSPKEVMGE